MNRKNVPVYGVICFASISTLGASAASNTAASSTTASASETFNLTDEIAAPNGSVRGTVVCFGERRLIKPPYGKNQDFCKTPPLACKLKR